MMTNQFAFCGNYLSKTVVVLVLALMLPGGVQANENDWVRFLGNQGDATAADANVPVQWDSSTNLKWKTALPGPGASSPVVHGDRVYLTCYTGYGVQKAVDRKTSDQTAGDIKDLTRHLICLDRASGALVNSPSVGGLLSIFAPIAEDRGHQIASRILALTKEIEFVVPSHDPTDPRYDAKRYWRGPTWLIVNYMIADGLRNSGQSSTANQIVNASIKLIEKGGFAEYYDPKTGEPCGGSTFTWTAAMVIEFLALRDSNTGRM